MLCGSFLYFIPLLIQLLDYFGNALRGLCNNAENKNTTTMHHKGKKSVRGPQDKPRAVVVPLFDDHQHGVSRPLARAAYRDALQGQDGSHHTFLACARRRSVDSVVLPQRLVRLRGLRAFPRQGAARLV